MRLTLTSRPPDSTAPESGRGRCRGGQRDEERVYRTAEEGEAAKYITSRFKKKKKRKEKRERERAEGDSCAGGVDQFNTRSQSQ